MKLIDRITFGIAGTEGGYTRGGWSAPEEGATWTEGPAAHIAIPLPFDTLDDGRVCVEITLAPFLVEHHLPARQVRLAANGIVLRDGELRGPATLGAPLSPESLGPERRIVLRLEHPPAGSPSQFGASPDPRQLGCHVREIRVMAWPSPAPAPLRLPALVLPEARPDMEARVSSLCGRTPLGLMLSFEILGEDRGFAAMLAQFGADPLGLLRETVIGQAGLAALLRDPAASPAGAEPLLARLFRERLATGERLFVVSHPARLDTAQAWPLAFALQAHGPGTLLVVAADGDIEPGAVERIGRGLLHGRRPAGADVTAWLGFCANAFLLWRTT